MAAGGNTRLSGRWPRTRASANCHAAPGNPGIAGLAELHAVVGQRSAGRAAGWPGQVAADLVVIGPEAPLVAGVADALRAAGIAVFGPDARGGADRGVQGLRQGGHGGRAASRPLRRGSPRPRPRPKTRCSAFGAPYVVKDDALAAGKGVVVTEDFAVAMAHAASCERVVIEEYLDGPEVSLFAVADGRSAVPLLAAQDFKRARDGDHGPNTGGMGAYVPLPWAPPGLADEVLATVVQPAIDELARRGTPYRGLLYAGLALTSKGVKVVEFNARFGDPETQVVLDRLATPLAGLLHASAVGDLADRSRADLAPGRGRHGGDRRRRIPRGARQGRRDHRQGPPGRHSCRPGTEGYLLHAGTALDGGDLVTAGGRVLNAVGSGPDLAAARAAAYAIAERVEFRGGWYRRDIAERASAGA